jgi:hypothetical protein
VLLYLNGQVWGLYNLTERIDLQMLRSYSDKDAEWDVIVKESGWDDFGNWYSQEEVKDGGYGSWLENQNWIGGADFTIPENIGELEWRANMENVFSYMFLQAYVGSGAAGRTDLNTVVRVHSPHDSITRILEKPFISFCGQKHKFVNRAREYLGVENTSGKPEAEVGQLSKERVSAEIIKQADIVRPFMQLETDRWAPDLPGVAIFEQNVQKALTFVDEREEVILHHLDILRYQTFTECK